VRGVLYTSEESEGKRQKNPFDTITEGVGQNRLTANFAKAQVDGSFQCSDQEAIDMVRSLASAACSSVLLFATMASNSIKEGQRAHAAYAIVQAATLLRSEGLFVGSSAAVNCVGAMKVAETLGPGHTIVTILCDSGERHLSKFYSKDFLQTAGFAIPS